MMELAEALKQKKKEILSIWLERTLNSYTSPGFFKKAKDPFANPVGVNIDRAFQSIFDLLLQNAEIRSYAEPLDQVIRIRAVQDLTAAEAVAPLLELKWVIKQVFSGDDKTRDLLSRLDDFDCEIDRVALAGFDVYVECRERLYQLRIQELKSGNYVLTDSACPSSILKRKSGGTEGDNQQ